MRKKFVESKNGDYSQDTQQTSNQASPTTAPISGRGSSGKFSLLLFKTRCMLSKVQCIRLLTLSLSFEFTFIIETRLRNRTPDNAIIFPVINPSGNAAKPSVKVAALSTSKNLYQLVPSEYHAKHHPRCRLG